MSNKHKTYISTTELAEFLGISTVAVFKRIKSGRIKAHKIGRSCAIDRSYLQEHFPKFHLPEADPQEHISIIEAASLLKVSRIAVYKKVKSGNISAKRVGRHFVIARSHVDNILADVKPSLEMKIEGKSYFSVPEFAEKQGVSRIAIFKQIQKGMIQAKKVGRHYVITIRHSEERSDEESLKRDPSPPRIAADQDDIKTDHMSVLDIAKILGISRIAVFKKIKKGQLEAIKIGPVISPIKNAKIIAIHKFAR